MGFLFLLYPSWLSVNEYILSIFDELFVFLSLLPTFTIEAWRYSVQELQAEVISRSCFLLSR